MALDKRPRRRERLPWPYKRDKNPKKYRDGSEPQCEPHQDRYADQRGMNRSHYRSDGAPKRAYLTEEAAQVDVLKMAEVGRKARCYRCPVCRQWHLATDRSGSVDPTVLDQGGGT